MIKKNPKLNQIYCWERKVDCLDCGKPTEYYSLQASTFFGGFICAWCSDTSYRRSHEFKNPEDEGKSHKKVEPYEFMEKEQHECAWLSGLVSDLRWLVRLSDSNKLHIFNRWQGIGPQKEQHAGDKLVRPKA